MTDINMDTQNANPGSTDTAFEPPVSQQGQVEQPQQEAPSLNPADAFAPVEENSKEGQPVQPVEPQQNQEVAPPLDNDKVRYEYWQSQAAKAQNKVKEFEQIAPLVDYIKQNPYVIQNVQQAQQGGNPLETPGEQFPEAPTKPEKPRNFNREEAMSDSSSESAKYMDDMDEWRDQTDEYNRLFTEYQTAKIQENFDAVKQREIATEQARLQAAAQQEQASEIQKYAIANFGADAQMAAEFVKEMSSPESVSMDNLWQLFLMRKGINQQPGDTPNAVPSPAFQQTQAAQQIPSSMGVMPAATTASQGSDADSIMDNLIDGWKAKNPF